jgi:hypothetical protein
MDDLLPDILDQCLARLADGATVDECLAAYPAQQAELELPLRTAARVRELPRPALPAATQAGLETQLLALAAARRAAKPVVSAPQAPQPARTLDAILVGILRALGYAGSPRQPWLRLAGAAIAVVLALVLGAGALAAARGIASLLRPLPAPTATPSPVAPPTPIVIDGPIDQIAQEGWVVGGVSVVVSSTTSIEGLPAVGAIAHVRGVAQANAGLLAQSIVVEQLPTATAMPTATAAITPTATPSPTLSPAPAPTAVPAQPAPADGGSPVDDPKKQCQGQQRGRDEKKCDPKPHEEKKPPKPKPSKK